MSREIEKDVVTGNYERNEYKSGVGMGRYK